MAGAPSFNAVTMTSTAHPDSYYADIPQQADSADIDYYVFARDNSGRRSFRPVIAPDSWITFNTGAQDPTAVGELVAARDAVNVRLAQNSPNPFRGITEIGYELLTDSHVRLDIFDVTGRKVATLIDEHQSAGHKTAHWSGQAANGADLPGGVYFYKMQAGERTQIRKMVLLK